MKQSSTLLARRYLAALRRHLQQGCGASLEPALRLGRQSVMMRLGTLELARIHEQALLTLLVSSGLPGTKAGLTKRAEVFFTEVNGPIEETRGVAGPTGARLRQQTRRLLAAQENERQNIGRKLQNEIVQTLLGINVHLLALKQEARGKTERFENEIASTQRLVVKSASVVRRAARKFVTHEPKAPDLVAPLSGRVADPPEPGRTGKPGIRARTGR